MIYKYDETQLADGIYIVDIIADGSTQRTVGEHINNSWLQLGIDYDTWLYSSTEPVVIDVIAKIELDTPTEIRMM